MLKDEFWYDPQIKTNKIKINPDIKNAYEDIQRFLERLCFITAVTGQIMKHNLPVWICNTAEELPQYTKSSLLHSVSPPAAVMASNWPQVGEHHAEHVPQQFLSIYCNT
jgi:hypothetical protein